MSLAYLVSESVTSTNRPNHTTRPKQFPSAATSGISMESMARTRLPERTIVAPVGSRAVGAGGSGAALLSDTGFPVDLYHFGPFIQETAPRPIVQFPRPRTLARSKASTRSFPAMSRRAEGIDRG